MTWKSQADFGDHVGRKLPDISYLMLFLSWHALKHFKTVGKRWGILEWGLLHVITRSIAEMMYGPSFTKMHSQKKEIQLSNCLKGWIFVTLHVFKPLEYCKGTVNNFGMGFFAHCHQDHWQNEIHYKVNLSTLCRKRKTTFHGAFLLRLSVGLNSLCDNRISGLPNLTAWLPIWQWRVWFGWVFLWSAKGSWSECLNPALRNISSVGLIQKSCFDTGRSQKLEPEVRRRKWKREYTLLINYSNPDYYWKDKCLCSIWIKE